MDNMLKKMRENFPTRTVVIEQSLEVARIVAGPDICAERSEYSIIFPYG